MGTYMIPRNTKGEGRILFIFSTKALIYTVGAGFVGMPFYYILNLMNMKMPGMVVVGVFAFVGFCIGTFKIPNSDGFKVTRLVGGENIDDIILRYIKFKQRKNKIDIPCKRE